MLAVNVVLVSVLVVIYRRVTTRLKDEIRAELEASDTGKSL